MLTEFRNYQRLGGQSVGRSFTLPQNTRSVNLWFFNSGLITDQVLQWWLHSILATAALHDCELSCGTINQLHWTLLCCNIYRFIKEWGRDLCVALHISVDDFRRHDRAPCQSPEKLPWVAEMAHLVFHVSSRGTICSHHSNYQRLGGRSVNSLEAESSRFILWLSAAMEQPHMGSRYVQ